MLSGSVNGRAVAQEKKGEMSVSTWALTSWTWSQGPFPQVVCGVVRSHLSPSGSKPSITLPGGESPGVQISAEIVQLQAVLQPSWFRADGQRGMAKVMPAESR